MIQDRSLDELLALDIPERVDVVDNLLPLGDAVLLSAREKSGKGFLAVYMALCIAAGLDCLGRRVRQGPVIYLALEESKRTLRDRFRVCSSGHTNLPIFVASLDGSEGQEFKLDDHDSINGLRGLMLQRQPVLVVLDVLREAHDGRENESDDMAGIVRPIRQLAHEYNVCILVTHHASKNGGFRGSTSIPAAFDDSIEFVRDDLETDVTMRGLLTGRGRDLPKVAQYIEFDPETFHWKAIDGAPTVSQPANIREKILRVVNTCDDWLTAEGIADKLSDTKLQTVRNKLSDMVRERPCPILVEGVGAKGDPRRYHGIHRRDSIDTHHSGNNPGTTKVGPTLLVRRCVQCDTALEVPNVLYCPEHGGPSPLQPTGTEGEVKI